MDGEGLESLFCRGDRGSKRVGDAELEFPFLGPVFGLLILADFYEESVLAGLELNGEPVLVDLAAAEPETLYEADRDKQSAGA